MDDPHVAYARLTKLFSGGIRTKLSEDFSKDFQGSQDIQIAKTAFIGQNVKIGKGCFLTAQTAVAGSSIIEDFVSFGGRASVSGHITVGTRARLAAKSGVTKSLPGNETYAGMPARKISDKSL